MWKKKILLKFNFKALDLVVNCSAKNAFRKKILKHDILTKIFLHAFLEEEGVHTLLEMSVCVGRMKLEIVLVISLDKRRQ